MTEGSVFRPPRRRGILFHSVAILVFGAASAVALIFGINQKIGAYFLLLLLIALTFFGPLPWLIYRLYALNRATYRIERDGLRLRWGLRAEDIPLPEIEWIRRATDMAIDLPKPPLAWPGALLGVVNTPDLGKLEYMASSAEQLLLIATPKRVYAISPEDANIFLRTFQDALEMGSLSPLSSVSVLPAAYLSQVWSVPTVRILLAAGMLSNLILFGGVSLLIPRLGTASLGFYSNGAPLPPGPAEQMLLLPILSAMIFLTDLGAGLFFYRRKSYQMLAYILWGSAVVTAVLLIIAALLITGASR